MANWDEAPPTPKELAMPQSWDSAPPTPQELNAPRIAQLQAQKAQLMGAQKAPVDPGALLSSLLGTEQGATMGFAPRLNAAVGAGINQLTEPNADYSKDYNRLKQEQEELDERAKATHPWLHGAGEFAGTVAATAATGGENLAGEGIAGAAKLGAGYGALTGLSGTKDLTNVPQAAGNAALGGAIGLGSGALGGAITDVVKPLMQGAGQAVGAVGKGISELNPIQDFKNAAVTSATQGNIVGKKAASQAMQSAYDSLGTAQNAFNTALNSAQQQAEQLRAEAPTIDFRDFYKDITDAARKGIGNSNFQDDADSIKKVHGIVRNFLLGTQDDEGNLIREGTGLDVTPEDAMDLKRKLGNLGSEGDTPLTNKKGLAFANRIMSPLGDRPASAAESSFGLDQDSFTPLKDLINNSIDNLPENQKKISQMLNVSDDFPDLNTLLNAQKQGTRQSIEAKNTLNDFYSKLPPELINQIKPALDAAANKASEAEITNASGLSDSFLGGKGVASRLGAVAGNVYRGSGELTNDVAQNIANSPTGQATRNFTTGVGKLMQRGLDQTPEWFTSMGSKLANAPGSAGKLGKALLGAASKDQIGRNAVIFALSQQPEYRDVTEKYFGNGSGIDNHSPVSSANQLENVNQ